MSTTTESGTSQLPQTLGTTTSSSFDESPDLGSSLVVLKDLDIFKDLYPPPNENARKQIVNLLAYKAPPITIDVPRSRSAGVLVLLSVREDGELQVTLTTRSTKLRAHPGDTAFPGGRADDEDSSIEATALREASEEIHLPLPPSTPLHHLTTYSPFLSATLLAVFPSIYLLKSTKTHPTNYYLDRLKPNPDEVDKIFQVGLDDLIEAEGMEVGVEGEKENENENDFGEGRPLASKSKSNDLLVHSYHDLPWFNNTLYRLNIYKSQNINVPKITGLTADMLLRISIVAKWGASILSRTGTGTGTGIGIGIGMNDSSSMGSSSMMMVNNNEELERLIGLKYSWRAKDQMEFDELVERGIRLDPKKFKRGSGPSDTKNE